MKIESQVSLYPITNKRMNEWSKDDKTKSGNKVIKITSKKERRKAISTHITGSILETTVKKLAPKKERKLYNLCKNHWT